jgi:hypothetical protein
MRLRTFVSFPLSLYLGPRLANAVSARKRPSSLYLQHKLSPYRGALLNIFLHPGRSFASSCSCHFGTCNSLNSGLWGGLGAEGLALVARITTGAFASFLFSVAFWLKGQKSAWSLESGFCFRIACLLLPPDGRWPLPRRLAAPRTLS